jgi:predicted  nucleic acid-binding Zn-ribbon protein
MRTSITEIRRRIRDKEDNIHGWKMRIMQGEEDIYSIKKRLEEFTPILKEHQEDLIKLQSLLKNRLHK